ncbi:MAG: terminase small subunit [Treponema sp.]|jgi:phage terminase small subunit|nr:terminase small subunit [Treponema sp.]
MGKSKAGQGLNDKQAAFCREYVKDCNGAQAAIRAGYAPKNAEVTAAKLLRLVKVRDEISALLGELLQEAKIPLERKIFDYWMIRAFYDITEIISVNGVMKLSDEELRAKGLHVCIDSINQKVSAQGETIITYKFADKDRAAEMLQKYIRMIREEVTIKGDIPVIKIAEKSVLEGG